MASLIARTAMALIPIAKTMIAMTMIQSNSSSPSAVEIAGKTYRNVFIGYLAWLVIAGLVTAFFTWWVWRTSSRQQDAIVAAAEHDNLVLRTDLNTEQGKVAGLQKTAADAERDLAEQKGKTATLEKAASDAQSQLTEQQGRTASLEKAAADAQKELAGQKGRTAILEKAAADAERLLSEQQGRTASLEVAAADAKAAQQRVEIALAQEKERAARAEERLFFIAERLTRRRSILAAVRPQLTAALRGSGNISIRYVSNDHEAEEFAKEMAAVLTEAGWHVLSVNVQPDLQLHGQEIVGRMYTPSGDMEPTIRGFHWTLFSNGLPSNMSARQDMAENEFLFLVGSRP